MHTSLAAVTYGIFKFLTSAKWSLQKVPRNHRFGTSLSDFYVSLSFSRSHYLLSNGLLVSGLKVSCYRFLIVCKRWNICFVLLNVSIQYMLSFRLCMASHRTNFVKSSSLKFLSKPCQAKLRIAFRQNDILSAWI